MAKKALIIGGIVAGIVVIAIASNSGSDKSATTAQAPAATSTPAAAPAPSSQAAPPTTAAAPAKPAGKTAHVVYKVTGAQTSTNITYSTDSLGKSAQANGEALPWSLEKDLPKQPFGIYTLIAQNAGDGAITCEIEVDGKQVDTQTSTGAYAVVTCSTH